MKTVLVEIISSLEEFKKLIEKLNVIIEKNSIVLLEGDLGAGKTTLVSYFCELHNILNTQSPTYALHNRYSGPGIEVDHFDLYRLEDEIQVEASGFYDLMNMDMPSYKFIEWSQRLDSETIESFKNCYRIKIELINSSKHRKVCLQLLN